MKSNIIINDKRCKGCLLCTTVCPKSVITKSEKTNDKGYYPATAEEAQEECVQCKFCTLICPDGAISVKLKGDK